MSRPIFSRPRTRVYNCNYDKGESYYKPMVDHLDRKYSSRPLFPEPRSSIADEIAARRSDIGSRDLSGPRTFTRDLDLENESPRPRNQTPTKHNSFFGGGIHEDDEDTVYDIRGQRTHRRNLADDFASEVAATTRRFKAHAASLSYDSDHYDDLRRTMQTQRRQELGEKLIESAKSAMEEADAAFKRRSKFNSEFEADKNLIKWSKLPDLEADLSTGAASRARQTKARLTDLENEMEEMAERQAKRERRAAAIKAFVNDSADDVHMEQISKKVTMKSEKIDKHVTF
ncbi:uncharacterized protein [Chelonus insularis]|uniref:uncharacterized protein isoform X1 n=1 Tax=Chelonus insularis TaxID=460826 RepID=UPI00158D92E3|nr:uncharacterized protein LOC118074389 isoform X1 [Chelonus insularis]XP_034951450.1 uncharacterized protein LOC118074389 isoform X1 [Chelonus insularis]